MEQNRARLMRVLCATALALAAVVVPALTAQAEQPVNLGSTQIVDTVGALGGQEAEVESALNRLYNATGAQLFVVYVATFDGVAADESWATATAEQNGLGTDDVLLAVATEERIYDIFYPSDFQLDTEATREVENEFLPLLSDENWAGAALAAADGYREAIEGPGFPWGFVLGVLVVGAVVIGIVLVIGRRRASARHTAELADLTKLEQRASRALVHLDDSLTTSEQELGFAVAQFGTEASAPFVEALEAARTKVGEAFRIKQTLDDGVPETDEQARAGLLRILELCDQADDELDRQADAFDELRALEQAAPQTLVQVRADAERAAARLSAAIEALRLLEQRYSSAAVATVEDNTEQAEMLLTFVGRTASQAEGAIAAGKSGSAAIQLRTVQASVAQAGQLLDAIDSLGDRLAEATQSLDAVVADTRHDLAAAKAFQAEATSAELSAGIAAAEASLAVAESPSTLANPVARLERLTAANQELEGTFGRTRDAHTRIQNARVALDGTLATARGQIVAAGDFITTRRGGVGETARTRLAEANRRLDQAVSLAGDDPVAALAEAQQANSLAGAAISAAQSDLTSYQPVGPSRGMFTGPGVSEAVVGGIIGALIGGRGGGFGGGFGGGRSRSGCFGALGGFGGSSRSSGGSLGRSIGRSVGRSAGRSSRGRF
ncbi:TPM domain-containing protein [Marisediminicola antarctica]|nr:TPM domain-containing protein [Marisediminicola antarctica]